MAEEQTLSGQNRKDFLISYADLDRGWAEWIAAMLEAEGYHTSIAAWDVRPGENLVLAMDEATKQAERTLLVLSSAYLREKTVAEWTVAFGRDLRGKDGRVLPVRIDRCAVNGLLSSLVCIDLVDLSEQEACERLLTGVKWERAKPATVPFPASPSSSVSVDRAAFPPSLPPIWNVPYPQNVLFTGREELLTQLERTLHAGQPTALSQPQAISGLGGIGKTQVALAYAYRHRSDYQAVLWAQADTYEALISSYLAIARLLDLAEKEAQESALVVAAVKEWLQRHTGWLLILDNADELALVRDFLPPIVSGQVLLTTRAQAMGRFAHRVEVEVLPTEVGALFLLRRAGLLAVDAPLEHVAKSEQDQACAICEELGGLPLALDQAGAYLEETQCGLVDYQQRYQTRRKGLLKRRGGVVVDHPEPVATTWSLSFEQVEQKSALAAELLRLCAYLAPDAIAEEIITGGAEHLGPGLASLTDDPVLLDEAIAVLGTYSLVRRNGQEHTLSIHRLVQAVLRDQIDQVERQQWMYRAVLAVHRCFPVVTFEHWTACELVLPHALLCARWIEQELEPFPEAVGLLNRVGLYLSERALYREAEVVLVHALALRERLEEERSPLIAQSLSNLANLYQDQGRLSEAEPLYERALAICEQQVGPTSIFLVHCLNNVANLYREQGRLSEAEPLYERALAVCERQVGPNHLFMAHSLNNVANLYRVQGRSSQAEPLLERALSMYVQQLGPQHPHIAVCLTNLASMYASQEKYVPAECSLERALAIFEQQVGSQHLRTAQCLHWLAMLYLKQGKFSEAEPLCERALVISERVLGVDHQETRTIRGKYTILLQALGRDGTS